MMPRQRITEGFDSNKTSFPSIADCEPTVTIEDDNITISVSVSDLNQTYQ